MLGSGPIQQRPCHVTEIWLGRSLRANPDHDRWPCGKHWDAHCAELTFAVLRRERLTSKNTLDEANPCSQSRRPYANPP